MNQQNQIQVGNFAVLPTLTASEVGYPDSEECLEDIMRSFNLRDSVIALAKINLLLHQSKDVSKYESILRAGFCTPIVQNVISSSTTLKEKVVFNRESTLRLLSKSISTSTLMSTFDRNTEVDMGRKLGQCYLIANGLMGRNATSTGTNLTPVQRTGEITELIPAFEYAIKPSPWPHVKKSLVRTDEYLTRLEKKPLTFDVSDTFCQATGLASQDYQFLIFGLLTVALKVLPEEILAGSEISIDMKPTPSLGCLYDKLLPHVCVSIDELAHKAKKIPSLPNEFRLWRKYPLVMLRENEIFSIDNGFLRDKLDTGILWILRDQLEMEEKGKGADVIGFWGEIFEDYAASIVQRGIDAQSQPRVETCNFKPKYAGREETECTDIAVCGGETLVLLECKAPVLTAQTKFSGDVSEFYSGIKSKFIESTGIKQLCKAIQTLFHTNEAERRNVNEIDVSNVKIIYPVLVLSDRTFSLVFMNEFFNSEFQRFRSSIVLQERVNIMPLTLLTIDELEDLEPYLKDTPLHVHLQKWLQIFNLNQSLPFSEYLRSLREREKRTNTYMNQKFKRIHTDMMEFYSTHGLEPQIDEL